MRQKKVLLRKVRDIPYKFEQNKADTVLITLIFYFKMTPLTFFSLSPKIFCCVEKINYDKMWLQLRKQKRKIRKLIVCQSFFKKLEFKYMNQKIK